MCSDSDLTDPDPYPLKTFLKKLYLKYKYFQDKRKYNRFLKKSGLNLQMINFNEYFNKKINTNTIELE